jgi:GNAT superfamily N-acetyltransferase
MDVSFARSVEWHPSVDTSTVFRNIHLAPTLRQEERMLELVTLRARPDLRPQLFSAKIQAAWPEFMQHDPTASLYFAEPHLDDYLDTAFAVIDSAAPDVAVGRAFAVPFVFGDLPDRQDLPDTGWDGVIRWAHRDRSLGRRANALSALEITLLPEMRGRGGSRVILDAMRHHAGALGYRHMFAPVRPTAKHLEPFTSIGEYVRRRNAEGLPADPWLRVHIRSGGEIVKVAPASMVIPGSIADWSRWSGMAFPASGQISVPGALVPIHVSLEQDHAVYVEPNVWVRHSVT